MSRANPSRIVLILTISCIVLLSACRREAKSVIIGIWHDVSSNETMQFTPDGKVRVIGKLDMTGTYSFPDSTHLQFEFNGLGALADPINMEYALSADDLKLTLPNGKVLFYKRVR
jgi:hypothetical protein